MRLHSAVNDLKARLAPALPFVAIISAVIIFFAPVLFSSKSYFSGEILTQFYPWKHFLKSALETGKIPFWNPFVFSGVPFLADLQKGSFYPPSVVFLIADFASAFKIFIVSHFIFMGAAFYLLMRRMAFSKTAALAGALIFLFNSFTLTRLSLPQSLASFAYIPAILWLFMRFLDRPSFYDFVLLLFMLAAQALAGHAPTVIYTLLLMSAYFIFFLFGEKGRNLTLPGITRHLLVLASGALCVFLITMPQSGLFFELLGRTTISAGVKYSEAVSDSMEFSHLLSFLFPPGLDGASPLLRAYKIGSQNFFSVTAVFLAAISLLFPKSRLYKFFLFTCVLSLLLSLGKHTPVFSWFYSFLPFFKNILHPSLAVTMLCIGLPVLAGYAIDHLKAMTLPGFGIFSRIKLPGKYFSDSGPARLFRVYLFLLALPFLLVINHNNLYEAYSYDSAKILSFLRGYLYFLLIFGINLGLYFLRNRRQISARFHAGVIVFILFFELFYFVPALNPSSEAAVFSSDSTPAAVSQIKSSSRKFMHAASFRPSYGLDSPANYTMLKKYLSSIPSNSGILYSVYDASGNNPIEFTGYSQLLRSAFAGGSPDLSVLNLLNVGYIVSPVEITHARLKKLPFEGDFHIYANPFAYPIFFVSNSSETPGPAVSRVSWTRSGEYDFSMLRVEVSTSSGGYLVFSNNYYPGWLAYVDNKAAQVEKCFGIYMGVKIGPGTRTVIFNYKPDNLGLLISAGYFAFALLISFCLIYIFKDKKPIREL